MKKSTVLYAFLFFFLFVGWGITPAQAHIGEPCPHKDPTHHHCTNGGVPTTALAVFDANDNVVGNFISLAGTGGPAIIALEIGGNLVILSVDKNSIFGARNLVFEDMNCQTTPFIPVGSTFTESVLLPPTGVGPPGNTAYMADLNATLASIIFLLNRH